MALVELSLAEELVKTARKQLQLSTEYKKPRMDRIREFVNLANNRIPPRLRQIYNIPIPVMSGLIGALESDFDDAFELDFGFNDPADYLKVKKINAMWKADSSASTPNAKWDLKDRWDKHLAILSGRGIEKTSAESDPKYQSNFNIVHYEYFHCEPKGGGILEKHLFCGEEGIFKTEQQLKDGADAGIYYKKQVDELVAAAKTEEYKKESGDYAEDKFSKFKALGLDPDGYNWVGQALFNECEWALTYKGKRYYLLFDAYTGKPIRAELLKDVFSNNLYPWTSWATHEDPQVFWSKGFCDDFFPICMTIIEMINQELSNRAKRNRGARAFDNAMFPDVNKLDAAQYRDDALVPVDTKGGTRKISEGIYQFETPELQGTINLVNWLESAVGRETGVDEMSSGAAPKGAKSQNVIFARLQQAQKRIGHKAKSYTECRIEIGMRYLGGLEDHLSEGEMVELIGADGYGWAEFNRSDLRLARPPKIKVLSPMEQDKMNVLGKDQKIKALELLAGSKNINTKWRDERILRDVGGFPEEDIEQALDTQNYASRDVLAAADAAISRLLKGKKPDLCYNATIIFAKRILNFEKQHQASFEKKKITIDGEEMPMSMAFLEYVQAHTQIIAENMAQMAKELMQAQQMAALEQGGGQGQDNGQGQPARKSKQPTSRSRPAQQAGAGKGRGKIAVA